MDYRELLPRGAVDFFTSVPTPERVALEVRSWGATSGYRAMFGKRWSALLGLPAEALDAVASLPAAGYLRAAADILSPHLPDAAQAARRLREAGITRAVVHAPLPTDVPYPIDDTASLVAADPELYVGFVRIDPTDPRRAAAEIRRGVGDLGLRGVTLTPFWHGVRVSDPDLEPIFQAAAEVQAVVWIHTSLNWNTARPLELEHPRHIDELAGRYPQLKIVCGHGGFPWVQDLIMVAWRHQGVYIDFSAFRPQHVFVAGSGWDALAYYGSRTVQHKIVLGTTWTLLGVPPETILQEAADTPWPDDVKRRWLCDNAWALLELTTKEETR